MNYEVTATRKRPQVFEDLKGQDFVVSTIKSAIDNNKIAHAYLFSGPRGCGKTTSARLLAKALNCENGPTSKPCGKCSKCIEIANGTSSDVIEIDGASNTSVNDIRVIKEEVMFQPSSSRYKIYIIDEVHMLSINAFNALLKTIEEPPEYIVFIFATTETHKVPSTIKSRCQQFNFQLFDLKTIVDLLKQVCLEKEIKAEDKALVWIAKEATGSMRDAYTLFDQVVAFSNNDITLEKIEKTLGIVENKVIEDVVNFMIQGNRKEAITLISSMIGKGSNINQIIKSLASYFESLILIHSNIVDEELIYGQISNYPDKIKSSLNVYKCEAALSLLLDLYRNIRYSLNPKIELELAISKLCSISNFVSVTSLVDKIDKIKKGVKISKEDINLKPVEKKTETIKEKSFTNKDIPSFISSFKNSLLVNALSKSNVVIENTKIRIDTFSNYSHRIISKEVNNIINSLNNNFNCTKQLEINLIKKENNEEIEKPKDEIVDKLLSTFGGKEVKYE